MNWGDKLYSAAPVCHAPLSSFLFPSVFAALLPQLKFLYCDWDGVDGVWQPLAEFPNERVFRWWQYKTLNRVASSAGRAVPLLSHLLGSCWQPAVLVAVAAERHRGLTAVSLCQEGLAGEDSCNSTQSPFTLESRNLGLAVASSGLVPESGWVAWASVCISELGYRRLHKSSDQRLHKSLWWGGHEHTDCHPFCKAHTWGKNRC